jgi:hypothetical protein
MLKSEMVKSAFNFLNLFNLNEWFTIYANTVAESNPFEIESEILQY